MEKPIRLKPWWSRGANGKVVITVRYGSKPLQLADGCNAIELANQGQLFEVMTTPRDTVLLGEFVAVSEGNVVGRKLVFKKTAKYQSFSSIL